ncbi:MAG: methionine adenosyltransferase, partial [Thermoproteota archaeon]
HYNADKSLLVAGETEVRFGGGIVKKPMLLVFGDRATTEYQGVEIPVGEIAIRAAKKWIKENLRFVDPDEHVKYQVELKPGSAELTDIFKRGETVLGANDTSAAVGYAPLSQTERAVLQIEKFLNSKEFKKSYPETGEDVKVMGLRVKDRLDITLAMAFVDRYIESEQQYFRRKEEVQEEIYQFLKGNFDFNEIAIEFNTLDVRGRGVGGLYLTVLGTSAESGDSGQVGRGNRVNGIIPLNRPVSSEAAAGKNPVSHVGKIYNILTHRIAERIYQEVPGLDEVYVWLLSKIGQRIDEPAMTAAELVMKEGQSLVDVKGQVEEIINSELDRILEFCDKLAKGEIPLY